MEGGGGGAFTDKVNLCLKNPFFPGWCFLSDTGLNAVKRARAEGVDDLTMRLFTLWSSTLVSSLTNEAHGGVGQTLPGICCSSGTLPSCRHSGARCSWSWRRGGRPPAGTQPAPKPSHCGLGCHDPEGRKQTPHGSPSGCTSWRTPSICEPPPEFFYHAVGTAAPVFSNAVNLSSTPHCLHMATRSLCPGSLSYTAGDRYLHDSCGNWKQPL